jgi:hypothetical protein
MALITVLRLACAQRVSNGSQDFLHSMDREWYADFLARSCEKQVVACMPGS